MAQIPIQYSMFGFEMSFMCFYKTVPMYRVGEKYLVTFPNGYFATSPQVDGVVGFVDFYWKARLN